MTIPARYTRVAATLHWLVALLIVINVVLGIWANHAPDDWVRPMIDTHKSIGITVLGLAVLRLLWRLSHPAPKLPETYARWERLAAHGAHVALYVWIFALPITGGPNHRPGRKRRHIRCGCSTWCRGSGSASSRGSTPR